MKLKLDHVYYQENGKIILNDLSFFATESEFVSVLSKNKEVLDSLIEVMLGVKPLRAGRIFLNERDITNLKPRDRGVALVTCSPFLREDLTVYDNIAYELRCSKYKEEDVEAITDKLIEALDLDVIKAIVPPFLSTYQKLKVSLARSIIFNPDVIIFDDPLSIIDSERKEEYINYIKKAYDFLNKPTIIYVGRVINITRKVITISDTGELLDSSRKDIIERFPSKRETHNLINKKYDENSYDDKGISKINNDEILLDAKINDMKLYYFDDRHFNLNKILLMNFTNGLDVAHMKLLNSYFTFFDYGGSLSFPIISAEVKDDIIILKTKYFSIVRFNSTDYHEGMDIFYPFDQVIFYDDELNRLNSLSGMKENYINVNVINQYTGLLDIQRTFISMNTKISKTIKQVNLKNDMVYSLSFNKKDGIEIKQIIYFEEFSSFYLISFYLKKNKDIMKLKVNKEINPITKEKIYLVIKQEDIKIPTIALN